MSENQKDQKIYTCPKCSKVFNSKYSLQRHLDKKIDCSSNDKKCVCEYCDKSFTRPVRKNNHIDLCKFNPNNTELFDEHRHKLGKYISKYNGRTDGIKRRLLLLDNIADAKEIGRLNEQILTINNEIKPMKDVYNKLNANRTIFNNKK